jgi:catechol 2,3-dioxygenase-like lactoylglutathione lyase family enzyme
MDTSIAPSPVNFHVSLNVSDLARSVDFYQKLFGVPPAKARPDYAKFESENPPLTLSLEPVGSAVGGGSLNHVGFRLANTADLVDLQRRLEMAGLPSQREQGVECCYARQTKFWLHDPDRTLWEFYVLEDDSEHCRAEGAANTVVSTLQPLTPRGSTVFDPEAQTRRELAARLSSPKSEVPSPLTHPTDWEHRLGSEFPVPLPFGDESLTEVRLRGSFNVPLDGTTREAMFAEILRVLAPGGRVVLHQLTGDRPFSNGVPSLPGPAAVVQEVPVDRELLSWVEDGGFEQIRLVKFGSTPYSEIDGVAMREMIVEARKPAEEDAADEVVVYKGPFRDLVDDGGHVFRRGDRVCISIAAWHAIRSGPLEESFVCLNREPVARTI